MVKKIVSIVSLRSGKIVKRFKRPSIIYFANPKSYIPYNIVMPSYFFYEVIEKYLHNNITVVPAAIKKQITWQLLAKHNPELKHLRNYLIQLEGRDFPEKAWDRVAKHIMEILESQHDFRYEELQTKTKIV